MKMNILTDETGNIGALYIHAAAGKDAPTRSGIFAREGQRLHENVEVPDHLAAPDRVHELLKTYRVEANGGQAKLVEHNRSMG